MRAGWREGREREREEGERRREGEREERRSVREPDGNSSKTTLKES
jgi:hypothetical protein